MNNLNIKIIYLIFISSFLSCSFQNEENNNKSVDREGANFLYVLNEFKQAHPFLKPYKWSIYSAFEDDDGTINLQIESVTKDTVITAYLLKASGNEITTSITTYYVHRFIKRYIAKGINYELQLLNEKDTLYFKFFKDSVDFDNPEFIVGKYAFLYLRGQLDAKQHLYYEEHHDSLRRIRGNDLPTLPAKIKIP